MLIENHKERPSSIILLKYLSDENIFANDNPYYRLMRFYQRKWDCFDYDENIEFFLKYNRLTQRNRYLNQENKKMFKSKKRLLIASNERNGKTTLACQFAEQFVEPEDVLEIGVKNIDFEFRQLIKSITSDIYFSDSISYINRLKLNSKIISL